MEHFEVMLERSRDAVERFVRFRLPDKADADDVLQEIYLTAYQKFDQLKNEGSFKAWILSIARNKCSDYFRAEASREMIPPELLMQSALSDTRRGASEISAVREVLSLLGDKDRQILYLYFWKELPQAKIARRLGLPLGTVKSRLYTAKRNFKNKYPYHFPDTPKGMIHMKKLPEFAPDYKIEASSAGPFPVRWEELQGWLLVPRLGEKLNWGLYEWPSGKRTEYTEMQVTGKAEVHGIEGVEITAVQYGAEDYYRTGSVDRMERRFVAQLTDTHCRYLAESHMENGVRKLYTFLDGEPFLNNWGFGEDNCGNAVDLTAKGLLHRNENVISGHTDRETVDIVGRYTVTIAGKAYDTICVMDIQCFNDGVASEQYLDKNGRTVLWRRFNRDDWAIDRYQRTWSELLPENERITVNGVTYVHWYDCISDYIL